MKNIFKYTALAIFAALAVFVSGCGEEKSEAPIIFSVTAEPGMVTPESTATVTVKAGDSDTDELIYTWAASGGAVDGSDDVITWHSPETEANESR